MEARSQARNPVRRLERFHIFAFRIIEFITGICTALSGLAIWLYILITHTANGSEFKLADVEVFFMFVAPGFLVAIGSYLQTRRGKEWGSHSLHWRNIEHLVCGANAGIVFFALTKDIFGSQP